MPSRITGDEVYAISHPAIYADLIVTSAMPRAGVLASVRTAQRNIYLGALILIVLVVANAFYWWRQMVRNRLARDELAQSKATVDQALESMSDGFLLLDHENRAITWNRRFVELHPWLQPFLEAGATLQRQEGVAVPAWPTTHHRVATADWIESLVDSANRAEIEQVAPREHQRRALDLRRELQIGDDRAGEGHGTDEDADEDFDIVNLRIDRLLV